MREAALEAAHEAATAHKGGAALASAAINSSAIGKSPVVDVSNYYSPGQGTLSDESDDADVGQAVLPGRSQEVPRRSRGEKCAQLGGSTHCRGYSPTKQRRRLRRVHVLLRQLCER